MLGLSDPSISGEVPHTPERGLEVEYFFPFDWGSIRMTEAFSRATNLRPVSAPNNERIMSRQWRESTKSGLPVFDVVLMSEQELSGLEIEPQQIGRLSSQVAIPHAKGVDILIGANPNIETTPHHTTAGNLDLSEILPEMIESLVAQSSLAWLEAAADRRHRRSTLGAGALAMAASNTFTFIGAYKRGAEALQPAAAYALFTGGWLMYQTRRLSRHSEADKATAVDISAGFGGLVKSSFQEVFHKEESDKDL